jgi:hypothetical protein
MMMGLYSIVEELLISAVAEELLSLVVLDSLARMVGQIYLLMGE